MLARDSRFNHLSSEKENNVLILLLNLQTILTTDVALLNLKWHYTVTKWLTQQLHEETNDHNCGLKCCRKPNKQFTQLMSETSIPKMRMVRMR